jgi:hypothetical protein
MQSVCHSEWKSSYLQQISIKATKICKTVKTDSESACSLVEFSFNVILYALDKFTDQTLFHTEGRLSVFSCGTRQQNSETQSLIELAFCMRTYSNKAGGIFALILTCKINSRLIRIYWSYTICMSDSANVTDYSTARSVVSTLKFKWRCL